MDGGVHWTNVNGLYVPYRPASLASTDLTRAITTFSLQHYGLPYIPAPRLPDEAASLNPLWGISVLVKISALLDLYGYEEPDAQRRVLAIFFPGMPMGAAAARHLDAHPPLNQWCFASRRCWVQSSCSLSTDRLRG